MARFRIAASQNMRRVQNWNRSNPHHSTWLDNTRAKFDLNWRPRTDLAKLVDAAWTYKRAPDDPRRVWYPG